MQKKYKILERETWPTVLQRVTSKEILEVTLQVTEDCCMACTYCYQHNKTPNKMTFDIAKQSIDNILTLNPKDYGAFVLEFIGGEPLMEIDLIEQILEYTIDKMIKQQHPWLPYFKCSICSNGFLYFTPKVQQFFKTYNSFVGFTVSIDGNKKLHDSCRVDINGNATYDMIISAIKHYRNNYNILDETKMTISPNNILYLNDALTNLIGEGYKYISCNYIFEKGWDYSHATMLYNELKKISNYLINNHLYDKVFIRFFDEDMFQPAKIEDNENFCGGICKTGQKQVYYAVKYDGQIYPCIRYMNSSLNDKQPELPIGNINNELNEQYSKNIELLSNITRRSQSTDECFYCPIAAGCGWCSGYNYEEFGTPNKRATYICCMHQARALANVYYWNTLYNYLNINKKFKMYLPKDKALNIIDENEYNYLLKLSQEEN